MSKGLTPEHHGELNIPKESFPGGEKARDQRIEELRKEYFDDSVALQQIDVYAGDEDFMAHMLLAIEAIKNNDNEMFEDLTTWFDENYPDIKRYKK